MPRREKGTYSTLGNWVLEAAPRLPLAAGWVLLALESQSNYRDQGMTVAALCEATGRENDQVGRALALLVEYGAAVKSGRTYLIGSSERMQELLSATDLRKEEAVKNRTSARLKARETVLLNARLNVLLKEKTTLASEASGTTNTDSLKEEKELKEEKASKLAEIPATPDAFPPASPPAQDLTPEPQRADAQTADAVPEAAPSPEVFKTAQAIPETKTPPVGSNTSRAAPRAELPPLPVPPAAAFFAEVTGAFFAKVQAQHLARWHGQYTPEFIVLAWRLSALEERPTFAFADWLDRSPNKPWPDALRRRYELDVAPELASETGPPKPRELPVKPGDLVRWADGSTATVERCERVDFVTDHEDDARGYVPYSAIGRSVEVLHS